MSIKRFVFGVMFVLAIFASQFCQAKEELTNQELLKSVEVFMSKGTETDGNWTTVSIRDWRLEIDRTTIPWTNGQVVRLFGAALEKQYNVDIKFIHVDYAIKASAGQPVITEITFLHSQKVGLKQPTWNRLR